FGTTAFAGLSPAQPQDMLGRRRGTEVMVKADHPANLGLTLIEGVSNLGNGRIGDVTDAFLNIMKDGQQCTRRALMALQQTVDQRQVQTLIRHSAILTVTDKPDGCRSSESVGCGTHTTSRNRGNF